MSNFTLIRHYDPDEEAMLRALEYLLRCAPKGEDAGKEVVTAEELDREIPPGSSDKEDKHDRAKSPGTTSDEPDYRLPGDIGASDAAEPA